MSKVYTVVGGQYGSEAKGHVTAQLVKKVIEEGAPSVINIRVAGPNAGHTVYDANGAKYAFRQIPVGSVLGPEVLSVIAAGSEIDPPVLLNEIDWLIAGDHRVTLMVDGSATLIEDVHKETEADTQLVERIGSTGKGIGAARADRIHRSAKRVKDDPEFVAKLEAKGVVVTDLQYFINQWLDTDAAVIVEGTQGYGLGVHTDSYPQTTSSDCRAVDFLSMAGISPWHAGVEACLVVVVARVYPIRVAGNSGPMQGETTWEALGLPEERTTVTQKVRRVGMWDARLVRDAVIANGGSGDLGDERGSSVVVALTMVDQKVPEFADFEHCKDRCEGHPEIPEEAWDRLVGLCEQVQADAGAPLVLITTGPKTGVWL